MAFLAAIGNAINSLQACVTKMDNTKVDQRPWGHDITSLMDWNWQAAEQLQQITAATKASSGGLFGGLLHDLGPIGDVIGGIISLASSLFNGLPFMVNLFRGLFGNNVASGEAFADLMKTEVAGASAILQTCATVLASIPIAGPILSEMADNALLVVLGLGASAICMATGSLGPVIAATIMSAFGGGMQLAGAGNNTPSTGSTPGSNSSSTTTSSTPATTSSSPGTTGTAQSAGENQALSCHAAFSIY